MNHPTPNPRKYPFGTIIAYGPDNKTATKLVAAVFGKPGNKDPDELHRWIVQGGDIRQDPAIMTEVANFLKRHRVAESVTYDRIFGCPHEEGMDYPEGAACPFCPFWENVDRYTHKPKRGVGGPKIGRNDPCSCGSGRKYKKCCGK